MAQSGGGSRAVLWFRNDLRLHDNAIVAEAAQRVKSGKISEVPAPHVFCCASAWAGTVIITCHAKLASRTTI